MCVAGYFLLVVFCDGGQLQILEGPYWANIVDNLLISDLNVGTQNRIHCQQAWGVGGVAAKIRESGQYTGGKGKGCLSEG